MGAALRGRRQIVHPARLLTAGTETTGATAAIEACDWGGWEVRESIRIRTGEEDGNRDTCWKGDSERPGPEQAKLPPQP